jgi:NAD(P)H-binding
VIDARPTVAAPQHYIVMSSTGTDHGRKLPWPASWGYELLLGDVANDKEKEEKLLASSSLPWTVIKAVILTNGSSSTYHTLPFSEYHP